MTIESHFQLYSAGYIAATAKISYSTIAFTTSLFINQTGFEFRIQYLSYTIYWLFHSNKQNLHFTLDANLP